MGSRNSDGPLDYWREFFRCADKDIIQVIMSAISVAKSDHPRELIANRQAIIDSLYPRENPEMIQNADEAESKDADEAESQDNQKNKRARETEDSKNGNEDQNLYESKGSNGEIEEQDETADELLKIKVLLANWQDQGYLEIRLQEFFGNTPREEEGRFIFSPEFGMSIYFAADDSSTGVPEEVAVDEGLFRNSDYMIVVLSGLQDHPSKQVSHLAKILIEDWMLLSPEWMNFSTTFQENIQDVTLHQSPVNDECLLSCPPLDVEFLTFTPYSPFDLSTFFDEVDDDGNPRNMSSEFEKNERQDQLDENDLEDGEIPPDRPLPQTFHEEATIGNPRNMGREFEKNESQDQIDENDLEAGEISPDWPMPQAFNEEVTISNRRNMGCEFEKNKSHDQVDENDLEDGEVSPDWPLLQAFHEEATISIPRIMGSQFEKNELHDQIDENDLEDGEISPDWLLPQAFHEEATINSNTHRIQEPVAAPPTYLQNGPKTCKELSYDIMAEKIERRVPMVTINFGRRENGETMMMHEQDITPPRSMQAFNKEVNVGSNAQKMQKHFEISRMRVHDAGILPLKPAKFAMRTAESPAASLQVPVRPLLQEKAKGNDSSQKRQEHYVFKQFKKPSSQAKLEKNKRKAQRRRINAERKKNGMMIFQKENRPLKPTKAGQMWQQPNGFGQGFVNPCYQHLDITKRKIQESYQHLDKVKKLKSIQVLGVEELPMFGVRRNINMAEMHAKHAKLCNFWMTYAN